MPMMVRRRGAILARPTQRARLWLGVTQQHSFSGAPGTPDCQDSLLYTQASIEEMDRPTLTRLRGFISPQIVTPGANSTPVFLFAGIGVQNEKAVNLGGGSLPCPFTDADWNGWLWQAQFILSTANPTIRDATNSPMAVVDGKGQRKLGTDDLLFFSTEIIGRPSDTGITFNLALRTLFLNGG